MNSFQNFDGKAWEEEHETSMLKMSSFIESILTDARRKRSVKLAAENARKRGATR